MKWVDFKLKNDYWGENGYITLHRMHGDRWCLSRKIKVLHYENHLKIFKKFLFMKDYITLHRKHEEMWRDLREGIFTHLNVECYGCRY